MMARRMMRILIRSDALQDRVGCKGRYGELKVLGMKLWCYSSGCQKCSFIVCKLINEINKFQIYLEISFLHTSIQLITNAIKIHIYSARLSEFRLNFERYLYYSIKFLYFSKDKRLFKFSNGNSLAHEYIFYSPSPYVDKQHSHYPPNESFLFQHSFVSNIALLK